MKHIDDLKLGYWDHPVFWSREQLTKRFAGWSTDELRERLEHLHENPPADTGMPSGQPRDWHCLHKEPKCPLCVAWEAYVYEATAIGMELRRRHKEAA